MAGQLSSKFSYDQCSPFTHSALSLLPSDLNDQIMSSQVPLSFQNPWVKFIHLDGYCQTLGIQIEKPGERPCSPAARIPEEKDGL